MRRSNIRANQCIPNFTQDSIVATTSSDLTEVKATTSIPTLLHHSSSNRHRTLPRHYNISVPSTTSQPDTKRPRLDCSVLNESAHCLQYGLPNEILLKIFSYLPEQDVCHLSQVCKRFNVVADDNELWKNLFQNVYEYDYPLFNREPCGFEFISPNECKFDNPWKESFRHIYGGLHVRPGYKQVNNGRHLLYFNSIQEALNHVHENVPHGRTLIFLHSGTYCGEFLMIDSDIALIGAAHGNVAESVIIENNMETVFTFIEGAEQAYIGHLTLKFSPNVTSRDSHHKHYCLDVGKNCSPTIDHCIIRSSSSGSPAVCIHGAGANPTIRHCVISNLKNFGLFLIDCAQGTYEHNIISEVVIINCPNPIMWRNQVHDGRRVNSILLRLSSR